jgi:hypothetical protein
MRDNMKLTTEEIKTFAYEDYVLPSDPDEAMNFLDNKLRLACEELLIARAMFSAVKMARNGMGRLVLDYLCHVTGYYGKSADAGVEHFWVDECETCKHIKAYIDVNTALIQHRGTPPDSALLEEATRLIKEQKK